MAAILLALKSVTVEPVMLIDGACNQAMLLFIENVQMNKICSVNLGYSSQVCENLSQHPEESVIVQKDFSVFAFYNSIIASVLSLIFVLFMGSWSDKYGRKIPLLITLICHVMYAGGYLLNNWQSSWPVEAIYVVTFLDALGGANMGLLSSTISYISDISPEKSRTSRVSTANSMWHLGGPLGTLIGAVVIKYVDYNVALGLVLAAYASAVLYVLIFIKESHGPFAQKTAKSESQNEDSEKDRGTSENKTKISVAQMLKDFFNWRRVVESFKTAFMKREGSTRAILLSVIFANMLRRVGRGFFMYMFVRRALEWDATDYGYWVSYRNLLAALGSLFLVPLLTKMLSFSDYSLIVLGSISIIGEYVSYGFVSNSAQTFLMWMGPPFGIISNASVIAFRSMSTKLVSSTEKGRVSAVLSAMNGLMPMVAYAAYSPIYYKTVDNFPAAQFFFGAGLNILIMVIFLCIQCLKSATSSYDADDFEAAVPKPTNKLLTMFEKTTTVTLKSLIRTISGPAQHKSTFKNQGPDFIVKVPSLQRKAETINEERDTVSPNSGNVFQASKCYDATVIANPMTWFQRTESNPQISVSSIDITQDGFPVDSPKEKLGDAKLNHSVSEDTFQNIPLDNDPIKDVNNSR